MYTYMYSDGKPSANPRDDENKTAGYVDTCTGRCANGLHGVGANVPADRRSFLNALAVLNGFRPSTIRNHFQV